MTQSTRRAAFLHARMARNHHLGLPLTVGILAVLCACGLFALVAVHALSPGALVDLDQYLADWLHVHAASGLTQTVVLAYTHLHGTIGVLTMSAVLAFIMVRRRAWTWLLTLVVTVVGGDAIQLLVETPVSAHSSGL